MSFIKIIPSRSQHIFFALFAAAFIFLYQPFPFSEEANQVLAIAFLMIFLWITEAMPMSAVALIPLISFPLMGVLKVDEVCAGFSNPVIFLFMGGFFLSLAIEKWNLHKRIALNILHVTGTTGDRIILGFIISTAFLSMWLSNTATTMMMFPIALSVIQVIKKSEANEKQIHNFSLVLMVVIAYASNFGGVATIIGTPPNVAFISYIKAKHNLDFSFLSWMLICTPLTILILISLYFCTTKWLYPNHIKKSSSADHFIQHELKSLGKAGVNEKRVLYIFLITASLWIMKDLINSIFKIKLDDSMIAIFGGLLLFAIPAKNQEQRSGLLHWADTEKMAWGILLLFGGGISLALALEKVGILKLIGEQFVWIAQFGTPVLIICITILSIFLSELMSNIAQVIVMAPIVGAIAVQNNINPILLGLPMTLAASCASMLPMGTPPNAIVFSSGLIPLKAMVRLGFILNIICSILISLFSIFILPYLI